MDVDDAIKHYAGLAENVFTDGKFKATKLEKAIKSVVETAIHDPESPLLEGDHPGVCRT